MKLNLQLTGIQPMIQHNGRLANPLDPWTRQLKTLTSKRRKTDEDLVAIMRTEARGSCYETDDGLLGFPTANVWRCIYDAAKAFKRGEDIKRGFHYEPVTPPLLVWGGQIIGVDEWLEDPTHIDYRPMRVNSSKTMRARAIVPGWSCVHYFEVLEDVIDPRDLVPILERAGRLVGLGDSRPTYGTFSAEVGTE